MSTIRPAWIERDGERTHAIVTLEEWTRIEELLEDEQDLADARRVLADPGEDEIPAELAFRLAKGESPVKILREARGLTQAQLAGTAGLDGATVAVIEAGQATPSGELLRKLASALGVRSQILEGWD